MAFARTHDLTGNIYTVKVGGGEPTRLTSDDATLYGLAWMPDGADLVFSAERGASSSALWKVSAAGGTPMLVPGVGENIRELSVARKGDRLAFAQLTLDTNIYRIEMTGQPGANRVAGTPVSFVASTRQEGEPNFSPDGRRVLFRSNRSGGMEIWMCDSEGRNAAQLTNFDGPRATNPRWSPDGRSIALSSNAGGNADIYVMGAEGSSPQRFTTDPTGEITPNWSVDGRWIYFASNRTGRFEVWKMPAGGGAAVQVTHGGGVYPAESPDRRTLFYVKGLEQPELWEINAESGAETPAFAAIIYENNWAVVRRGIYFINWQPKRVNPAPFALGFFDFSTRQTTQITTITGPRGPSQILGLTVSPDERWLLYTQRDQLDYDLMLVENFR